MNNYIYRLRSIETLLKYDELEKQEIYFAPPEELNDPMEGYKDIFWEGDEILWKALLKNYLSCSFHVYVLIRFGKQPNDDDILVHIDAPSSPWPEYRDHMSKVYASFFKSDVVAQFINFLVSRGRIGRTELRFYLKLIHYHCLATIRKSEENITGAGLIDCPDFLAGLRSLLECGLSEDLNDTEVESILNVLLRAYEEFELLYFLEDEKLRDCNVVQFYLAEFPERYIRRLEKLMHPTLYVASFLHDPTNIANWSHYAKDHSGVCLKFRTRELDAIRGLYLQPALMDDLKEKTFRSPLDSIQFFPLHQVEYVTSYLKFDFFRCIGSLSLEQLKRHWYMDENGVISARFQDIVNDITIWRKAHRENFRQNSFIKTPEWRHETESRLHLHGIVGDIKKSERKLRYDFNALEGIVFGMNTTMKDKLRIIDIIRNKCAAEKRSDFKFYQASYSNRDKKMYLECLLGFSLMPYELE